MAIISETEILQQLNNMAKIHKGKTNSQWTVEIKVLFSKYFNEKFPNQNYLTAACGLGKLGEDQWNYVDYPNEYLFDLTIFQEKQEEIVSNEYGQSIPFITKTLLALECEWGDTKDVIDDFQKLLISNAEYKVMIFEENRLTNINSVLDFLIQNIAQFSNKNGTFIFACFQNPEEGFKKKIIQ